MEIKKLRKENGSNPNELAKLLNISVQAYYKYENEINEPNIENLCKLADYYNVSIDFLIGRENYGEKLTKNYKQKKELLQSIEKLTNENFEKLVGYVTALLDNQNK